MLSPASSRARVVSASRSEPKSRRTRARSSRCWMSMKARSTKTKTAPPTGSRIFGICQSGLGADTITGSGFVAGGFVRWICASTSCGVSSIFWSVPPRPMRWTSLILRAMVARYCGRSSASTVTWLKSAQPSPTARKTAKTRTTTTAGTRCSPSRRRSATTGLSRNVNRIASAIGMNTMRAQYRQAIATITAPRTTRRDVRDASTGLRGLTRDRAAGPLLRPNGEAGHDAGDMLHAAGDLFRAGAHLGVVDRAREIDGPSVGIDADLRQGGHLLRGELGLDLTGDRGVVDVFTRGLAGRRRTGGEDDRDEGNERHGDEWREGIEAAPVFCSP